MTSTLCEVRIPTYNRPILLKRALNSLLAQTHRAWTCKVYDDSTNDDAQGICASLGDPRISYHRNPFKRGASGNIDHCFSLIGDAEYYCVLEDDNFLFPAFIEQNIQCIQRSGCSLVLRNQRIEDDCRGSADGTLTAATTLASSFHGGIFSADLFRTSVLFGIGVSNGGLFWRRGCKTKLEVCLTGEDAAFDEYLRTFSVRDAVCVEMEPLAVWRNNGSESTRSNGAGGFASFITAAKMLMVLRQTIYDDLETRNTLDLLCSHQLATAFRDREIAVRRIARRWPGSSRLGARRMLDLYLKATALQTVPKPRQLTSYLSSRNMS